MARAGAEEAASQLAAAHIIMGCFGMVIFAV